LLIKSEQDTNEYKSKQQQASLTLATGSGSGGSYSQQNVNSSYTSVTEQSGIQAGNGGFDIVVGGDTKLVGGAIVSSASSSLNTLSTDSLTAEDLKNKAEYEANSLGVSVSGSGFKPTLGLPQSDKDSSVTHSAIAAGSMEVRNGNSSALDGIKRDTDELANSGLKKIFDEQKVSERMEIGSVATDLVRNYQAQQIRKKQEAIDDVQKRADQALADGNLQLSSDLRAEVVSLREDRDGGKVGKTLTYAGVGFGLSLLTGSSSLGDTLSYAKDLFLYNGAELNADTAIRQGHETQAIAFTCGVGKTPDQCAGLKPPAGKGVDGLLAWGKENDVVINFLNEIPEGANIIATNGILNNPQRAGQLAMGHDRRSKVDDTVYVQYYGTGGLATDLFAAGWEKFAVPFGLNSSETTRSLADAILRQGDNADLELLAHSRGTIVMANALAAVADSGYKNDNSGFNSINVGSAVRAGRLANPIKSVIGDGRISDHMVYLNNPDDFMPSILGVSFIGGTKYADPSDADYYVHKVRSNFWKSVFGVGSLGGDDTAHNGYINNNIKSPNNWNEKKVDEYNKMVGGK
ncbi:hypothetical protein LN536_04520, partial [Xanthomonas vesicatoria]|nr:hypothetical protein [Xanthomonas vesicatoria]MCC8600090.1 hypothetical protein [Xanthomonas vesicatoria]MCC8609774.1 hypothetical protein [Xanthomonas vesicatoria]MCC8672211.1 hypothetical protein [Xanthomonas vesicatoria]MCC8676676.1 hypothetical protein [Xanthomonas vesicatoria]